MNSELNDQTDDSEGTTFSNFSLVVSIIFVTIIVVFLYIKILFF